MHVSHVTSAVDIRELKSECTEKSSKSANRGHISKPNLPSFSVSNKVLMSL